MRTWNMITMNIEAELLYPSSSHGVTSQGYKKFLSWCNLFSVSGVV